MSHAEISDFALKLTFVVVPIVLMVMLLVKYKRIGSATALPDKYRKAQQNRLLTGVVLAGFLEFSIGIPLVYALIELV